MSTELTAEAAQGYDAHKAGTEKCPHLNTSASACAWHLGRHLAKGGFARPGDAGLKVFAGRGDTYRLDTHVKPTRFATSFRWNLDNTFKELA